MVLAKVLLFLRVRDTVFLASFIEKTFLFPEGSWYPIEKSVNCIQEILFLGAVFHWSVCLSLISVTQLIIVALSSKFWNKEMCPPTLFFFFNIVLLFGVLWDSMWILDGLSLSQKYLWDCSRDCIESVDHWVEFSFSPLFIVEMVSLCHPGWPWTADVKQSSCLSPKSSWHYRQVHTPD